MTVRISELNELSSALSQTDVFPVVDLSAGETKKIEAGNLIAFGISGAPSGIIDLSKLNQGSATKLDNSVLIDTGVAADSYGSANTVAQFVVNARGVITSASGVPIVIASSGVTGLAPVATSGTYASLSGLPTLGTLSSQDADSVAISGGTVSGVVLVTGSATISGGTISGITDIAVADGGTGASSAADARTNLGLVIGANVQAYSAILSGVAAQFDEADEIIYASASGVIASTPFTAFARSIVSGSTASGVRSTLGLGTLAVQDAGSIAISGGTVSGVVLITGDVTISGGTISGITDLAIDDGGTGASSAEDARTNLGLVIGTDVQPYSAVLSGIATQFDQSDEIVYASASGVVAGTPFTSFARSIVSGSTASGVRDTLGLGTLALQDANSVAISGGTISGIVLTTGDVTISGGTISGITDLAIDDGGTGASSAADARTNLGLVIGTDVQAYASALSGIAATASGGDLFFYTTSSGAVSSAPFSSAARDVVAPTTISGIRDALGLGDVATLDTIIIDSGNVAPNAIVTEAIVDQSITTAKIATNAVSLSLLAQTAEDTILGRATAGSGNVETIACTAAARSILDDATIADIRTTLGLGNLATENGTLATGTNTGDQTITLTGDVTGTGTDTFAATIADAAVTEGKLGTSAVATAKIADNAVTADKLADSSAAIVAASSPAGDGAFIGQQWFNTNNGQEFTWTGSAWVQQAGIGTINIVDSTPIALAITYPDAYSATLTTTLDTQAAATVFAGPATGTDTAPTFRAIVPTDIPDATASTKGIMQPGTGLAVDAGTLNHSNTVSGATISSITFDNQGHITAAVPLVAADIPDLDVSKITTGEFSTVRYADSSITASKIADYANAQIGETLPVADHIGQFFFNPLEGSVYLWDGNVWQPVGVTTGAIAFAGTFNASAPSGIGQVTTVTSAGAAIGLVAGSGLPAASLENSEYYLVVSSGGTITTGNAPFRTLAPPDLILSDGTAWVEVDVSTGAGAITASNVSFDNSTSGGEISAVSVQTAITEVSSECRNADNITSGTLAVARGGTGLASYAKGDLIAASGATTLAKLPVGTNTHVLRANSSTATGLEWGADFTGTVTTVSSATAALTIATATTTPALTIRTATTSVNGIVQLSDSTGTTSSILAATPTAVKSAYDLAALALPKAGGTVTGDITLGTNVGIQFEGTTDDANEIRLIGADATADRTITLPNVTGTVITTGDVDTVTGTIIASGTIVNANINNSAAIAYGKLALSSGIVNTDISASAAIALSKLATGALPTSITVSSGNIVDGTITNADVNASAAIAYSKLALSSGIVNTDINASAAIALSKLATGALPTGITISSGNIVDGTITNADVNASAAIAYSKLALSSGIVNTDVNGSAAIAGTKISPNFGSQTVQTTGIFSHALGTATAPTVTFTGDTNTGLYSPGSGQVAISTNGAGRLFVDSVGDVGVGISVPTAQLHVVNIGTNDSFIVEDSGSDTTPFRIAAAGEVFTGNRLIVGAQETYNDGAAAIGIAQINGAGLNNSRTFSHIHWGAGARFRHCSTPSTTLGTHTISALNNVIGAHEFYASDGVSFIPSASIQSAVDATPSVGVVPGNLTFSTAPAGTLTERMRLDSTGRLGLGTSSPDALLTVNGIGAFGAGAVTTPSIAATGDLNTGFWFPAADTIAASTAGSERVRIRSDGNVSIGGVGSAAVTLYNQGAITGGTTAYANWSASTIQSDVTTTAFAYRTQLTTAAAAFTLVNAYHYAARQIALGADSAITNQFGFGAESSLTGATNNYGFHGNLASATGCWNFYAAGTAPNYFAGDLRTNTVVTKRQTPSGSNTSVTLTAASIIDGLRTGTPAAGINYTLPTGTNMDAAFQELQNNQSFEWSVLNLAGATHAITVLPNTGHTVEGNMVVAANSSGRFLTRKATTNTFTTYRIS